MKRGGKNKKRPQRNALDTTMAWGDIMTLLATQLVCLCTSPVAANTYLAPITATLCLHLSGVCLAWKEHLCQCKAIVNRAITLLSLTRPPTLPVLWCTAGQPQDSAERRAGERAGACMGGHGHSQGRLPAGAYTVWPLQRAQGRDCVRAAVFGSDLGVRCCELHSLFLSSICALKGQNGILNPCSMSTVNCVLVPIGVVEATFLRVR